MDKINKSKTAEGEYLKDNVSNYDSDAYKKPSVTIDIAVCSIINNDLKVLLIKRKFPPYRNCRAIPGGFVDIEKKESLENSAIRELKEETGLKDIYFEQLKTYGDPDRDPRMRIITVVYFALVPYDKLKNQKIKAQDDADSAQWFSLRKLPENLAFDHKKILNDLLIRLIGKISYTPIAFSLISKKFTWSELQNVYGIILGRSLLAPNFRRKIKAMYVLKEFKTFKKIKNVGRPPVYLNYVKMKEL